MSYGFKIIVEGDYACYTRPEMKVERVSYEVPTPSAIEGMLKSIYWKPAIRYVVDKIIVFNPINFFNVRRNEVKNIVSYENIKQRMKGADKDLSIYTTESRSQRSAMLLKNVRYGIEFHFELTGLRCESEVDGEAKHYSIIKRRIQNGQYFRQPCFGCSEFPVRKIVAVDSFNLNEIHNDVSRLGDVDLGYMLHHMEYEDKNLPINGDWEHPKFSDKASAVYYHPHMVNGVINVNKYWEGPNC